MKCTYIKSQPPTPRILRDMKKYPGVPFRVTKTTRTLHPRIIYQFSKDGKLLFHGLLCIKSSTYNRLPSESQLIEDYTEIRLV